MLKIYPHFADMFSRYMFGVGKYPINVNIKTPIGKISPWVYSYHDLLTVNEIFCRKDYLVKDDSRVIVDIGANIGISALYFLTRNRSSKCYLFEPVPSNIDKMKLNLENFIERTVIRAAAVSDKAGTYNFGIEESGRYGSLERNSEKNITVEGLDINDVLEEILNRERSIDILKVDVEGTESKMIHAIKEKYLPKIKAIYVESDKDIVTRTLGDLFRIEQYGMVFRLYNKSFESFKFNPQKLEAL